MQVPTSSFLFLYNLLVLTRHHSCLVTDWHYTLALRSGMFLHEPDFARQLDNAWPSVAADVSYVERCLGLGSVVKYLVVRRTYSLELRLELVAPHLVLYGGFTSASASSSVGIASLLRDGYRRRRLSDWLSDAQ